MLRRSPVFVVVFFSCLTACSLAARASVCDRPDSVGASLLFPYFEVDLAEPQGRNTLIAINNADDAEVLAHVVLWTNWGVPTLAFDLFLQANGTQTLSMRNILNGSIPETSPPPIGTSDYSGCARPLALPSLAPLDLLQLRSQHTGQSSPIDLNCSSTPQESSLALAVGYLTVDVMNDCSDEVQFHADAGYFVDGGLGLASNRNALWGDFFFVDSLGNHAQGLQAVAIEADASRFGPAADQPTFYVEEILAKDDNRAPLSHTYRTRFLHGGDFDGGTEVIVWHAGFCVPIGTFECGAPPLPPELHQDLVTTIRDLDGVVTETTSRDLQLRMTRLQVGGPEIPTEQNFGHVEIRVDGTYDYGPDNVYPRPPAQAWIIPLMTAENRFSVGLDALGIDGECED